MIYVPNGFKMIQAGWSIFKMFKWCNSPPKNRYFHESTMESNLLAPKWSSLGPSNKSSDSVVAVESRNVGIQLSLARAKKSCQRPLFHQQLGGENTFKQLKSKCQMDPNGSNDLTMFNPTPNAKHQVLTQTVPYLSQNL